MQLELSADADSVTAIGRLKPLAANRDGRPRGSGLKIVWHDSPEHALLADNLALSEQRGIFVLERLLPGSGAWLPAQPPPLVATSPDLTMLQSPLPSPLAPLAAFEGRRTTSIHRFNDASVTLTIDKGILRAVTAERPVARILLQGDETAVHAAASLIVDAASVSVPLASLAAEAIALATGRPPSPRRHGAPVLPDAVATVPDALAHIMGYLTDVILAYAPHAAALDDTGVEAVHQMRVAVRRARSALSIFRPAVEPGALAAVNTGLKTLGRQLGPSRDWDVFVDETIPSIREALPNDPRLEKMAAAAARRRRHHRTGLTAYLAGVAFRRLGVELAIFAASLSWHVTSADSLATFGATVLQLRWKKLVGAGKRLQNLDIPGLHGVRLRAKRSRYAAEMFATLYQGKSAHRFIRRLSSLQQRLGVLNDGAVATHLLQELGGAGGRHAYAAGVVAGFIAARTRKSRPRIERAFEKLRRQPIYWA